jgi:hypothetical protein
MKNIRNKRSTWKRIVLNFSFPLFSIYITNFSTVFEYRCQIVNCHVANLTCNCNHVGDFATVVSFARRMISRQICSSRFAMARILFIEPFFGGSHKQLLDTLISGLFLQRLCGLLILKMFKFF